MAYRRYQSSNLIWTLIGLNVIVFIGSIINPDRVYYYLALQPASFSEQPWTIVTTLFVHSYNNPLHIIFNMLTLYFFGTFLLQLVGDAKFLIIYFGGGILGSIFFMLMPPSPLSIVVGASGAIFSLGGTLAMLRPKVPVRVFPIPAPIPLWIAVIGGFLLISFLSGIAWQAHLGGIVFGLIYGYFLKKFKRYY